MESFGLWVAGTSKITSSQSSTINFPAFKWSDNYTNPTAGRQFFITNVFAELDTEKEWYIDNEANKIYFWAANNADPNTMRIEAKRRPFAFVLSGRSYINIEDISIIGTSINTKNADHCMIKNIQAQYVSHSLELPVHYSMDNHTGIQLGGNYNTFRDSTVQYSSGNAIVITGSNNNVINNEFSHSNYLGTYNTCISLNGGNRHLISYNTAHDAGRDILQAQNVWDCIIERNEFYNPSHMSWDSGTIYIAKEDMEGTEFRYNKMHDIKDHVNAIYMDGTVENIWIHHNTAWNIGSWHALNIGQPNNFVIAENNMFDGDVEIWDAWKYGSRLTDNIITGDISINNGDGIVIENNRNTGYDQNIYGDAGHDFDNPPYPIFKHSSPHLYRNRVENGYFDREAQLRGWTKYGETSSIAFREAEGDPLLKKDGYTRTGYGSIQLGAGQCGIKQTITGLEPNTTYELSGWAKATDNTEIHIGVQNFGGEDNYKTVSATGKNWSNKRMYFTTGDSNTSATIYYWKNSDNSELAYVDDISVKFNNSGEAPKPEPVGIAFNKPVTSSSQQSSNAHYHGNDDDIKTRWCANSGDLDEWWQVDLGQIYDISKTKLTWEFPLNYQYKIEGSRDGSSWQVIANKTSYSGTDQVQIDSIDSQARYIKITITGLPSGKWASFYDFKVYEKTDLLYYVDCGDDTVSNLETSEVLGSHNSKEDQAYGLDETTNYTWGYETFGSTWTYDYGDSNFDSLRTDEGDTANQGITYKFELDSKKEYRVTLGFKDPWNISNRKMALFIENELKDSNFIITDNKTIKTYNNVSTVDGILEISIKRETSSVENLDPMISWIKIESMN